MRIHGLFSSGSPVLLFPGLFACKSLFSFTFYSSPSGGEGWGEGNIFSKFCARCRAAGRRVSHVITAVNVDYLAGNIRGIFRSKESYKFADFFRLTPSSHGYLFEN